MSKNNIDVTYEPLYTSEKRYFPVTGGRGSVKSFSVHDFVAKLTFESGHGILFTRYTMASAEKSIIPEFQQTIDRLGFESHFTITREKAVNNRTGSFIFFSGIKTSSGDQTAKLKSLHGITTWVVEEGEDFTDEETFDRIDDSIRQKGKRNRVIWIMNPTTREHFIYKRWFGKFNKRVRIDGFDVLVSSHPEVEHIHSTYLLAVDYLSDSFLRKAAKWRIRAKQGYCPIEKRKLSKEEQEKAIRYYVNNYLGGWKDKAEGVIFPDWIEGEFNTSLPYCYGQDYGFSEDPTTLIKVAVDRKRKRAYLKELLYSDSPMDTGAIHDANTTLIDRKNDLIIADSAEQRLISELRKRDENILPCIKGPGSVNAGIKGLQEYLIVVDPDSNNLKTELNNYTWSDKKAEIPIDDYNHLIDAGRYAFTYLTNDSGGQRRLN